MSVNQEKIANDYLDRYSSGFREGWIDQILGASYLTQDSEKEFTRPFRKGYEDGRNEALLVAIQQSEANHD